MRPKELVRLGVSRGAALDAAIEAVRAAAKFGYKKGAIRREVRMVLASPADHLDHELFGAVAEAVVEQRSARSSYQARTDLAPSHRWGSDLEPGAVTQLENARALLVLLPGVPEDTRAALEAEGFVLAETPWGPAADLGDPRRRGMAARWLATIRDLDAPASGNSSRTGAV